MPEYRLKLFRGYWNAVWSDAAGKTQRRSLRTKDRDEANRQLVDFRRDMAAKTETVGEIVQTYLAYKKDRIRDHGRLAIAWEHAKPTFGHLRPDQVTHELCNEYIASRHAMGRQDGTILKEINTIRQALNWAKKGGVAQFEAPPAPPARDRHLTRAEVTKLLAGCSQPHVRLFVRLALATAGRKTAVLSLTWDRIDFERRQIQLAVVGERNRKKAATVPITDKLLPELLAAKEAAQTPYVIEYAGERVGNIKKGFAAAVARAKLKNVTPHDLRHTAAVWMAEGGTPFEEIAQYLGHGSSKVTFAVYARFSPTHLRKAAELLDV